MSDTTLKMILLGDDKSASSALNKVGSEAEKTGGHFHKLAGIAAGVFGGEVLAEGAAKVGEFLKSSVEAAVDSQTKFAVLNNTMKNVGITGETAGEKAEKFLTTLSEASGTAKDALIPAYTNLIRSTGNVGQAHKLLSTSLDVAAGTGMNLTAVSKALQKAHDGNVGGLARLGVQTKDAAGKTLTFAQIQGELAQKFGGDWKAKANTAGGEYARLGVTFDNLKEKIGTALLPVLTQVGEWLTSKGIPAAEQLGDKIGTVLGPAFEQVGAFIKEALPSIESFATSLGQKLGPLIDKYGHAIGVVFKGAIEGAKSAFDQIRQAIERNKPQLEQLGSVISKVVGWLIDHLAPILKELYRNEFRLLGAAITAAIDVIGHMVTAIGDIIGAGKKVVTFFKDLPGKITGAFGDATKILSQVGSDIVAGLKSGIENASHLVIDAAKHLAGLLPGWVKKVLGIHSPSKVLQAIGVNAVEGLALGIDSASPLVDKAMGKISTKVKSAASALAKALSDRKSFADGFSGFAQSLFSDSGSADAPMTLQDVLAHGQQAASQASQYQADIKTLIAGGASSATLNDLASQGASGATAAHLLAGGGAGAIAQINASEAQQQAAYAAAGAAAADAVFGKTINKDLGTFTLDLKQDGKSVQRVLLKLKRENGGAALGLA